MVDFAYLFSDSAASWLQGHGDGRFARYEQFYRRAKAAAAETFDLEISNEEYPLYLQSRAPWLIGVLNSAAFRYLVIVLIFTYAGALFVPRIAQLAPIPTGVILACAFVAIRVKRRRQKRAR
jgi:predicted outer membrane lipoprotein